MNAFRFDKSFTQTHFTFTAAQTAALFEVITRTTTVNSYFCSITDQEKVVFDGFGRAVSSHLNRKSNTFIRS